MTLLKLLKWIRKSIRHWHLNQIKQPSIVMNILNHIYK